MSLRQDIVRLLIADDVGVGKTIEALLIVRELLERRKIKRFAVLCLPHLCEQWQMELKEKFDIDAVIIRSNTQARLDRQIHGDTSVYDYYPYQIISIDYIKGDKRRNVFIHQCPEMIIVDEAHTCARPSGTQKSQQLRHSLLRDIADKENQHLIMLTATPHSGKAEEFQSLLGLLKPEFEGLELIKAEQNERRNFAKYFVQRKRADVKKWLDEQTIFPERDAGELSYHLSSQYREFFDEILKFTRKLIQNFKNKREQRVNYWTALALMRGVMSSPAAGVEMLQNRIHNLNLREDVFLDEEEENPILDQDYGKESDFTPTQVMEKGKWSKYQLQQLQEFSKQLMELQNPKDDAKLQAAALTLEKWLNQGFHPVIFCRYIATAKYVGEKLKPILQKNFKKLDLQVVTSEDPDEVRKERIDEMGKSSKRILVATGCLSEGINLQNYFTAVLHYDLPWNPNRLEQREGRVDRFGQRSKTVKAYLLYGEDNPIDGVVLKVILQKVREIKKSIGISIPFPENSRTISAYNGFWGGPQNLGDC